MHKIMGFLEEHLVPVAGRFASQKYMAAIQSAFIVIMPFLVISSFFLILESLPIPGYVEFVNSIFGKGWQASLDYPVTAIFSLMSLYFSAILGFKLAQSYKLDTAAVTVLSTACYLIVTPFGVKVADKTFSAIPMDWLGAKGLFVAMLMTFVSVEVFRFIIN